MEAMNRSIGTQIKSDVKLLSVEAYQYQLDLMPELKAYNAPEFVEKSIQDTAYTVYDTLSFKCNQRFQSKVV